MTEQDFITQQKPTWCPGCGNHAMWIALRQALAELNLKSENILMVFGIGCSGNGANFFKTNVWHSLHGRTVPTAVGAKLANKNLTVLAIAGDGDGYGEGMGHLVHAIRGNANVTYIVHDNKVYGLTTGQAAPTAEQGYRSKSTPAGIIEEATNPIALALAAGGSFVARGFAGQAKHLKELFKAAILHRGFSLVDVFQPCITFNKINTFKWYFDRLYNLDQDKNYNQQNLRQAFQQSTVWGKKIPYGIFYQNKRTTYGDNLPQLQGQALVKRPLKTRNIKQLLTEFS
ncbi:MAG: 2-oxoacid ferredoxin oxidoreductase [Candidatus Komeilibacteria bacterium CG11_big_fil_rev_8_21_14_0_20_36_20]|uniref:2-oxoacid ferredoxin oxidoreductase n=1 Tax=Candidatus Komeilibacteria bacterium CG11_big_fil_rev_8_21_14_0_20_36_20 TaxID=1974477 RepID=A0A2H0NC77_9BACT|nr:MAG: 2-oxoacid ferredoxin oxidoreductase [Candidatus Komeilibacteria bacterium CG11_big_fil_rev_8_21_14_0_20_36_20]PIR81756.1 MAG: 2-oxoacid ferredoxin oxidoreductase [Candidatus Komeilibacteria bacterium CG10_big_fil_rev_8_21_14_0_10_36_65]PJC55573.1 MAG: 2-oxoacid ferredoxin oxidoreductase [Candidatus Komeilibacteria bacterium CG_4_9_14_0_2_um_filter_36_13]